MDLTIEDARQDLRATREQISRTADELSDRLHERAHGIERRVNPLEYAREYPWAAIAVATGLGLAISLTRADRKAAKAAVRGAKSAGGAIASAAAGGDDATGDDAAADADDDAAAGPSLGSRIRGRVQSSVHDLLAHGLDELLREVRGPR